MCCALRLLPLIFLRPGELRHMEWSWVDLDEKLIRVPAHAMKMKEEHLVPLSWQAAQILRDLAQHGRGPFVLAGKKYRKPIGENALNDALGRMGYPEQPTAHMFRTIASRLLREALGEQDEVIELQLANRGRNKVKAPYDPAERLDDRRAMMQRWSDYLAELKTTM